MYLLMSSLRGNPEQRPNRGRTAPGRATVGLVLLCVLLLALGGWPVWAEEPIRVISSQASYAFSESLTFTLQAQSASPIVEVVLFYGRQGTPLVRRIYPAFTPGTEVRLKHVEALEAGQFAPGTTMRYYWYLRTRQGDRLLTDAQTFVYTDSRFSWQTLAGERVDLWWYGQGKARAETLLARADAAVERLERDIGVAVAQRPQVYVYNAQKDMRQALIARSQGYDESITTLGVAVDERTLLLLGPHADAEVTVAHELSHIVVGLATDNPYTDLPRWLDEGLAMYAEGALPAHNRQALERAIRADQVFTLRSMTSYTGRAEQVDLFYGQAYSIVDFMLRTYGREKMRALLAIFARGALQEDALRQAYGFGLEDLERAWRASVGLGPRTPQPRATLKERSSLVLPWRAPLWSAQVWSCGLSLARG